MHRETFRKISAEYFWLSDKYEPQCEKTGLGGFRHGPTQTDLYSHR